MGYVPSSMSRAIRCPVGLGPGPTVIPVMCQGQYRNDKVYRENVLLCVKGECTGHIIGGENVTFVTCQGIIDDSTWA